MRVFRFDEEVSVPAPKLGSGLRIARLTGDDSRARIEVLHLARGAHLVCHEPNVQHFLGVLVGSGWVAGADGTRRRLAAGAGVLWESGEPGWAGTEVGLTTINIEGEFELAADHGYPGDRGQRLQPSMAVVVRTAARSFVASRSGEQLALRPCR